MERPGEWVIKHPKSLTDSSVCTPAVPELGQCGLFLVVAREKQPHVSLHVGCRARL